MINFHKYFQFFYLVIAVLFIYNAYSKFNKGENYWIDIAFFAAAIFMFFFKRNFAKKFDENKKK